MRARIAVGLLVRLSAIPACLTLAGCAAPVTGPDVVQGTRAEATGLSCSLPTKCVSSLGAGRFAPVALDLSGTEALTVLRATLAEYPEARIVDSGPATLVAIFRTPAGFEDEVVFMVDEAGKRLNYRSRSLLGLFDFGKNGSRMAELVMRFERRLAR